MTIRRRQSIIQRWLRGENMVMIAQAEEISYSIVHVELNKYRDMVMTGNEATLQQHQEQTVMVLKHYQQELWREYQSAQEAAGPHCHT